MHPFHDAIQENIFTIDNMLITRLCDDTVPWIKDISMHALHLKGKRIRASLMLHLAHAFTSTSHPLVQELVFIIEILHGAMLLHDDVIDNAFQRRHEDTVHIKWDKHTSILMGDYIYAKAFVYINELHNPLIATKIAESCCKIVRGEIYQNSLLHNPHTTYDDYLFIIDNKTAELFAVALECIALLTAPDQASWAKSFGRDFGRLYQMSDDFLDIQKKHALTNKDIGHDLAHGLVTLPTLLLYNKMSSSEKNSLSAMVEHSHLYDPKQYAQWLLTYSIQETIHAQLQEAVDNLRVSLETHLPPSQYRTAISTILDTLIHRTH